MIGYLSKCLQISVDQDRKWISDSASYQNLIDASNQLQWNKDTNRYFYKDIQKFNQQLQFQLWLSLLDQIIIYTMLFQQQIY